MVRITSPKASSVPQICDRARNIDLGAPRRRLIILAPAPSNPALASIGERIPDADAGVKDRRGAGGE